MTNEFEQNLQHELHKIGQAGLNLLPAIRAAHDMAISEAVTQARSDAYDHAAQIVRKGQDGDPMRCHQHLLALKRSAVIAHPVKVV